jgi:hypothetical protein
MEIRNFKDKMNQGNRQELWVGKNKVSLDSNRIVHQVLMGDISKESANDIVQATFQLAKNVDKINILIDLNKSGQPSAEARKSFLRTTENSRIDKIALWGLHPVARVLASFVLGISRNKNMRFFRTKEEALKWLLDEEKT